MTDRLRWGILGTGWIATQFVTDVQATGGTVSAVGSRTQQAADAFAAEYGIATAHPSYEALAADPEVDAIYVSTPHPFHASNALLALGGGKHVLVEKPFTMNAAEAQQVVDLATEKNLVVLEAMWTRWLPHMVRVREIIAAGTIGEVRAVIADHDQSATADPKHRMNNPDLGGGALLDLGIYPISFAWDMLGEPSSINVISTPVASTGVDGQDAIILGYPGGQQAILHVSLEAAGPNHASIIGTKGRIEIDRVWYTPTPFTVYATDNTVLEHYDEPVVSRGMQFQAFALEELVAQGKLADDILSPTETVAIMGTLDAIRASIGLSYPGESAPGVPA